MPRKKIVFVIVEGASDDEALGVILSRIYDKNMVYVHIMHCDITTEFSSNSSNIVSKIGNLVRKYARDNPFKQSDFSQIIHIADMDGAYIPNENIIEDITEKETSYHITEIRTNNKSGIENRNCRKRENLDRLASTPAIWKIPYRIYYMSCNLDHALYGKLNCSDKEKRANSLQFAKNYRNDIPAFLRFILKSEFSVISPYSESWEYIKKDLHSLERHTNLGLCFDAMTAEN